MRQSIWKDYFAFSKKERIAVWILLGVIVVFIILPYFIQPHFQKPVVEPLTQLTSLQKTDSSQDSNDHDLTTYTSDTTIEEKKSTLHLFYFDPNTLEEAGWKKLGLNDKTIHTVITYRNKGGSFKRAEDIRKIYGLKKEDADALIPYVQIKSQSELSTNQTQVQEQKKSDVTILSSKYKKIDINAATAEDFKSLPGIGDVLSNRIVKFRNAMHGFKSVEDIKKTYGLPDSTYQLILPYLTINDSTIQKN
jgi:competence protein ComEA